MLSQKVNFAKMLSTLHPNFIMRDVDFHKTKQAVVHRLHVNITLLI